jgi:hypothetical protein
MTDKTSATPAPAETVTETTTVGDVGAVTAAGKTIEAKSPPASKSELIAKIASLAAGMSVEKLTDQIEFFNKSLAAIGHEADAVGDKSAANKATIKAKPSDASASMKEDLAKVLEGEAFSEDFKVRMTAIFESVVNLRVSLENAKLQEEYEAKLAEATAETETKLQEQIDLYLSEAAKSWADENRVAIESSLKVEMVENFLDGLFGLCRETNLDLPKDKVDVVEAMTEQVAELQAKLDEAAKNQAELEGSLLAARAEKVFSEVSEGLTLLDIEKFKTLSETLDVTDLGVLRTSLKAIREAHFKPEATPKSATPGVVTEEVVTVIGKDAPEAAPAVKPVNEEAVKFKVNASQLDTVFGHGAVFR